MYPTTTENFSSYRSWNPNEKFPNASVEESDMVFSPNETFIVRNALKHNEHMVFSSKDQFLEQINHFNKCGRAFELHEGIPEHVPQKIKIDLDITKTEFDKIDFTKFLDGGNIDDLDDDDMIEFIEVNIKDAFKATLIEDYGIDADNTNTIDTEAHGVSYKPSHGGYKWSFHILSRDVHCQNVSHVKEFFDKFIKRVDPMFKPVVDAEVYKTGIQYFRMNGSSKVDPLKEMTDYDRRPFKLTYGCKNTPFEKTMVTYIKDTELLKRLKPAPVEHINTGDTISGDMITDILGGFDDNRCSVLSTWKSVMWAVKNIGRNKDTDLYDVFDEWSKNAPDSYNEADNKKMWEGIVKKDDVNIGVLWGWLKTDNPKAFKTLQRKYKMSKKKAYAGDAVGRLLIEALTPDGEESNPAYRLILSKFCDEDVADYFEKAYSKDYIHYDGNLYFFNGSYWAPDDSDSKIQKALGTKIYYELQLALSKMTKSLNALKEMSPDLPEFDPTRAEKRILKLRDWGKRQGCVKAIMCRIRLSVKKDIWDNNPDLLGFENGTLDLKTGEFREGRREDYISMSTQWDYKEPTEKAVDEFYTEFICKIQPIEKDRECILRFMSTGLRGQTVENIGIFTGNGRNGKDTLLTVMLKQAMGDYFYVGPKSAITGPTKTGGLNQEVANMHKKRVIVYQEPRKTDTLNCQALCELTGCDGINSRGLYSKRTNTVLHGTHIIMCNGIPMCDYIIAAFSKRLLIGAFPAQFLNAYERSKIPTDTPYVHDQDTKYKQDAWIKSNLPCFIKVLMRNYKKFQDDKYVMRDVPESMRKLGDDYMTESDEFYQWILEHYEQTKNKDDFVRITGLVTKFKSKDLYDNMSKKEKRKINSKKFSKDILENIHLKNYFRSDNHVGDKRHVVKRIIMWKPKKTDDEGHLNLDDVLTGLASGENQMN